MGGSLLGPPERCDANGSGDAVGGGLSRGEAARTGRVLPDTERAAHGVDSSTGADAKQAAGGLVVEQRRGPRGASSAPVRYVQSQAGWIGCSRHRRNVQGSLRKS